MNPRCCRAVLDAAGVQTVEEQTVAMLVRLRDVASEMAREFSLHVLRVDATGEYEPDMDAILACVTGPVS